jgi:outer membrane protein
LFNGFSLQNNVKQNKYSYQASKMDWQQAKDNLTIDIILAYLSVLNNEDQLIQAQSQATLSKKQVDRLVIMDKEGAIPPSQLSDLRGQYASDQLGIINAKTAVESAKLDLCQLMNVPYKTDMQLERIDPSAFLMKYEGSPDQIYEVALKDFSLVKATTLRRQSAEKGVSTIKGQLFPTLSLNGGANSNYSSSAESSIFLSNSFISTDDYVLVNGNPSQVIQKTSNYRFDKIGYGKQLNNNLFTSVGLSLRVPIFNSLRVRNQIKLAKIQLKNTELIEKNTKTQ